MAECGGFMYLHEFMEDDKSKPYSMVGLIKGSAYKTPKLNRFGYINLTSLEDNFMCKKGEEIVGHEFHYWDSTNCGSKFKAQKPLRKRNWECINVTDNLFAGYPHVHYYSNMQFPYNFLKKCISYKGGK